MWLANAVTNWEDLLPPTLTPLASLVIKIRFDDGITVTIRVGFVQAPSPTLTALLETLAATLSGLRLFAILPGRQMPEKVNSHGKRMDTCGKYHSLAQAQRVNFGLAA